MSANKPQLYESLEPSLGVFLGRVFRHWRSAVNQAVAHLGMTESRWTALMLLKKNGEGCTQQALAKSLMIELPSLTRTIKQLQEQGLIERRPDPNDRRAHCLWLTDSGRKMVDELAGYILAIRREMYEGLSDEQLNVFAEVLLCMEVNAQHCLTKLEEA